MPSSVERVQAAAARALVNLPEPVFALLLGGRRRVVEGQTLDARIHLILALAELTRWPRMDAAAPAEGRLAFRKHAAVLAGPIPAIGEARDLAIPGPAGAIPARLYRPRAAASRGLLVYYHGGGFVLGDLESHDHVCRALCAEAALPVLAVDYRLAPEHPFPAAVEDTFAAFRWAAAEAGALGVDPRRIAVGGDSAGGNLSAVVCQLARDHGGARPAFQLLVYPGTDLRRRHRSHRLFAEGYLLDAALIGWFMGHYLSRPEHAEDPRASPLLHPDLAGLPPALVMTGGFDPLRDEGRDYAERLHAAGVPVEYACFDCDVHGFLSLGALPAGRRAILDAAAALRRHLA